MRIIDDGEHAAWARRLSGGAGADLPAPQEPTVPMWMTSHVTRLDGAEGMRQLSNFGVVEAVDPAAFESSLLRLPVGAAMLYSTVQSAHTVRYGADDGPDEPIVIVGMINRGVMRLRSSGGVAIMDTGRMGFMSSLARSRVTHLEVTETTGVVVPVSLLPGHRRIIERGADILPDTPLSRAAGAAIGRMLYEMLSGPDQGARALSGTEDALISLVRALFEQVPVDQTPHPTVDRARRVIESRHRDPGFGIDELAEALHVSRRQLFRVFSEAERSAATMLLDRRLSTARDELLRTPLKELTEVARVSGFADSAALRTVFLRHVGMSPTAFRATARQRQGRLSEAMLLTDEQEGLPQVVIDRS